MRVVIKQAVQHYFLGKDDHALDLADAADPEGAMGWLGREPSAEEQVLLSDLLYIANGVRFHYMRLHDLCEVQQTWDMSDVYAQSDVTIADFMEHHKQAQGYFREYMQLNAVKGSPVTRRQQAIMQRWSHYEFYSPIHAQLCQLSMNDGYSLDVLVDFLGRTQMNLRVAHQRMHAEAEAHVGKRLRQFASSQDALLTRLIDQMRSDVQQADARAAGVDDGATLDASTGQVVVEGGGGGADPVQDAFVNALHCEMLCEEALGKKGLFVFWQKLEEHVGQGPINLRPVQQFIGQMEGMAKSDDFSDYFAKFDELGDFVDAIQQLLHQLNLRAAQEGVVVPLAVTAVEPAVISEEDVNQIRKCEKACAEQVGPLLEGTGIQLPCFDNYIEISKGDLNRAVLKYTEAMVVLTETCEWLEDAKSMIDLGKYFERIKARLMGQQHRPATPVRMSESTATLHGQQVPAHHRIGWELSGFDTQGRPNCG